MDMSCAIALRSCLRAFCNNALSFTFFRLSRIFPRRLLFVPYDGLRVEFAVGLHIRDRADPYSHSPDLTLGSFAIRVISELRGEVEGGTETCLSLRYQKLEPFIGCFSTPKARVLKHRPASLPIHSRAYTTCEWKRTRLSKFVGTRFNCSWSMVDCANRDTGRGYSF